jgi:hypothetical protein
MYRLSAYTEDPDRGKFAIQQSGDAEGSGGYGHQHGVRHQDSNALPGGGYTIPFTLW